MNIKTIAGAVLLSALLATSAQAQTVTLRADNWCPYNCEAGKSPEGYVIEIAKAVFEPKGLAIQYELMPWSRALADVKQGTIVGAIGASKDEGRDLVLGKEPIGEDLTAIAYLKDKPFVWKGAESLQGKLLGASQGYSYEGDIAAYLDANKGNKNAVEFVAGEDITQRNLQKLSAGRLDLVLDNAHVLAFLVKEMKLEDKVSIVPVGKPTPLYLAFTPVGADGKKYAAMLDGGINELRESGKLKSILSRYGLSDWKK